MELNTVLKPEERRIDTMSTILLTGSTNSTHWGSNPGRIGTGFGCSAASNNHFQWGDK